MPCRCQTHRGLRIPVVLRVWLKPSWRRCKKKRFQIVLVRATSWYVIRIQTDANSWAGAESSRGRDRGGYKKRSDLLHFRRNCGEEVEVHFKSEARAWGENLVKRCREGEARALRHPVESGERHNRSRHQQEAAPKPR